MRARTLLTLFACVALAATLAACDKSRDLDSQQYTSTDPLQAFRRDGAAQRDALAKRVQYFTAARRWHDASVVASYASSRYPGDVRFHFASARAYWEEAQRGAANSLGLAEAAAHLALRLSDGSARARRILAHLHYEQGEHAEAKLLLASLLRTGGETDLLALLVESSWRDGDLPMALWASERLTEKLTPANAAAFMSLAFAAAALGEADKLARARTRALALLPDDTARAQFRQWLRYWSQPPTAPAAQRAPQPNSQNIAPRGAGAEPVTAYPRWDDCRQRSHSTGGNNYRRSTSSSNSTNFDLEQIREELSPLDALPAPCVAGARPRTALIDLTIIKSTGGKRTSYGINVLRSLNLVFNVGLEHAATLAGTAASSGFGTTAGNLTTLTSSLASPRDGIQYALNIAEHSYDGVHIESRPTVMVMDRFPTVMFAGRSVTVALEGQYGGTLEEKPVGVVVNVTPTFLSDDEVLLALRTTHSKILEGMEIGSFSGSLATAKNILHSQARLRMGETLALSGMREKVSEQVSSEVPWIGRVPILNLFFRQKSTIHNNTDMTILVSLRSERTRDTDTYLRALTRPLPQFAKELQQVQAAHSKTAIPQSRVRQFLTQDGLNFNRLTAAGRKQLRTYMQEPIWESGWENGDG